MSKVRLKKEMRQMFLSETSYAGSSRRQTSGDPRSEARKPHDMRSALGQVFTPSTLADAMVQRLSLSSLGAAPKILDPCVGPDTFPAALRRAGHDTWTIDALDIDESMCATVASVSDPRVSIEHIDYLSRPLGSYDAAILNPPYVRQEWIRDKPALARHMATAAGVTIPGTSNLYVYFIVKVIAELRAGGRLACLVYDSWRSTLYGRWLREHLDRHCDWTSEPVAGCPFEGRLIDATIIYATKRFVAAKTTENATENDGSPGRARIDELFVTRRGLRLKQSDFFMTASIRRESEASTPFVKKVNRIDGLAVSRNHEEAALLISKVRPAPRAMAILKQRLAEARQSPDDNVAILTWADERPRSWHLHGEAPTAPILFNYFMRNRPKHIANPHGVAFSDNFYGLAPRHGKPDLAWFAALNSTASTAAILRRARNQGAGLAKVQLFEYRAAAVVDIREWSLADVLGLEALGRSLISDPCSASTAIKRIDRLISEVTNEPTLDPIYAAQDLADADRCAKRPGDVN